MFVGTDACPIDFLPEMQFCAAQGMDHRKVCDSAGQAISSDILRSKAGPLHPDRLQLCPMLRQNMKRCFYNEIRGAAEKRFIPMMQMQEKQKQEH
ncbi:hypothetical protein COOONC_19068 [Cooperia oncophora]